MIGGILREYYGEFLGNTKGEYLEEYCRIPREYLGNTWGNTWGILKGILKNTWRNTVEYLGNIQGILWGILREY